jgi:hypothetical protein
MFEPLPLNIPWEWCECGRIYPYIAFCQCFIGQLEYELWEQSLDGYPPQIRHLCSPRNRYFENEGPHFDMFWPEDEGDG